MRRHAGRESIRADVPEEHVPSDEGAGRFVDGTRRAEEGLASLCQQGAAWRDQHHLRAAVRFAKVLQLGFFPQLVRPATGEFYAHSSGQHFSAMRPIETSFIPIVKTPMPINIGLVVKVDRILEFKSLLQEK